MSATNSANAALVHGANAPVSDTIWYSIVNRAFGDKNMDTMTVHQALNKLNPEKQLKGLLDLAKGERSYFITHEIMCLMDSIQAGDHSKDSIIALIRLRNEGDTAKQMLELDLSFGDYAAAYTKADDLSGNADKAIANYGTLMKSYATLMQDTAGLYSLLTNNTSMADDFRFAADSANHHLCMQFARNILDFVFYEAYEIEKLQPEESSAKPGKINETVNNKDLNAAIEESITMFPNPASSELTINNQSIQNAELRIYNVNGQLLIKENIKAGNKNNINTAALINGIYFVNLYNQTGLNKTNKLVIVK